MTSRLLPSQISSEISEWREVQTRILDALEDGEERFRLLNAPTGSGKTLVGLGWATTPWLYLVATNFLQSQVASALSPSPSTVRGRRNFTCPAMWEQFRRETTAQDGWCRDGEFCPYHMDVEDEENCDYYEQLSLGISSSATVSNYHSALALPRLTADDDGFPTRESLICDEAHNIESAVIDAMSVTLPRRLYAHHGGLFQRDATPEQVEDWARRMLGRLPLRGGPNVMRARQKAVDALQYRHDWIQVWGQDGVRLTPVWGRHYTERLWGFIPRILLMSATLLGGEYTAELLGLPFGTWAYHDEPSTFDPAHRPVLYAPTVAMSRRTSEAGYHHMQERIDARIDHYVNSGTPTGLIHAVSNAYRNRVLTESRWRGIMTSDSEEHAHRVSSSRPSVLVAANRLEGWDGKDELCRFILMPKIPFPSLGDPLVAARKEQDERSYHYDALVNVVQGVGRGVRSPDDYCETVILDSNWEHLLRRRRNWLPDSFLSAYRQVRME